MDIAAGKRSRGLRSRPRVGGLYLVLDHVRQRRLDDLARVVRLLGRAVPEAGSETVRRGGACRAVLFEGVI